MQDREGQRYRTDYNIYHAVYDSDGRPDRNQNDSVFPIINEDILTNLLVKLYDEAQASAEKIENIRTERNSLEKLVIE